MILAATADGYCKNNFYKIVKKEKRKIEARRQEIIMIFFFFFSSYIISLSERSYKGTYKLFQGVSRSLKRSYKGD